MNLSSYFFVPIVFTASILCSTSALAQREPARLEIVSPGSTEYASQASGSCPTFHWSGSAEFDRYELKVQNGLADASGPLKEAVVISKQLPGGASGWSPASATSRQQWGISW